MRRLGRPSTPGLILASLCALAAGGGALLFSAAAGGQAGGGAIPREDVEACMACHSADVDGARAVNHAGLKGSAHKELVCQDCHSSITAAPHTPAMVKEKASCGACHNDAAEAFRKSTHSREDYVPGDHPTCIFCHGSGDPHAITAGSKWTRQQKVQVCTQCHEQRERMGRYKVDPDAVASYKESFHGKALLRFNDLRVAICTDCHLHHDVLSPSHPASTTHRNNAAKTCSQQGCHPGARVNFAMSGANHLRLKVKDTPALYWEEFFFRALTTVTILLLLAGVALDLRREVFGQGRPPRAGRLVGALISLSFLFVVIALTLSVLGAGGVKWTAMAAAGLIGLAVVFHLFRPRKRDEAVPQKRYQRFTLAQRIQHGLLALSFTLLVLTGMPLRFPEVEWLRALNLAMGGLPVSRLVHRGAALVMIFTWIWHTVYLLYRWKQAGFTLKSMTMLPTRKDLADVLDTARYYLGLTAEEPKFDRFQFREKFDYFAVYWGMPIMVLSGLVLWFPIYFGNLLPEVGLSAALIAHSDEAVLAFLAIVLWHFYNTHFNPDSFPMSGVFLTGTMTREEMEREHPLELERLEAAEGEGTGEGPPDQESSPPGSPRP